MKKFSSFFICFHTDIMNKYIFPVQQKISWKFSVTYFSGKATSLLQINRPALQMAMIEDSLSKTVHKVIRDNVMSNDIFWVKNENLLTMIKPIIAVLLLELHIMLYSTVQ